MRLLTEIIIHNSASDRPCDDSVEAIKELHMSPKEKKISWGDKRVKCFGWDRMGYPFVITKDGIEFGENIDVISYHCRNRNTNSIGICVTGNLYFSDKQLKWLEDLLRFLMKAFNIPKDKIYPHNKFNKTKTCPNFDLTEILGRL